MFEVGRICSAYTMDINIRRLILALRLTDTRNDCRILSPSFLHGQKLSLEVCLAFCLLTSTRRLRPHVRLDALEELLSRQLRLCSEVPLDRGQQSACV